MSTISVKYVLTMAHNEFLNHYVPYYTFVYNCTKTKLRLYYQRRNKKPSYRRETARQLRTSWAG